MAAGPETLVLHYTGGSDAPGALYRFCDPDSGTSAHLIIDRDGSMTQLMPLNQVAWHAGTSRWTKGPGVNAYSVGIELVNAGRLMRGGQGGWVSQTGDPIPAEQVVEVAHRHTPGQLAGWQVYTKAQLAAAASAVSAIAAAYGIGTEGLVGHDDISPDRELDPGPALDMDWFRSQVFGRDQQDPGQVKFRVNSPSGLNLRSGPMLSDQVIKLLDNGTVVRRIDTSGRWWMVAELIEGQEDATGYVHSRWLTPA